MSHFSVLVIGDDPESQLAPYHEFECTGEDDEHVVEVDRTQEALETFASQVDYKVRLADGTEIDKYIGHHLNPALLREPTAVEEQERKDDPFGFKRTGPSPVWDNGKVFELPVGAEEFSVPTASTFAQWAVEYFGGEILTHLQERTEDGKYGYVRLGPSGDENGSDVRVIDRTNATKWRWIFADGSVIGETVRDAVPEAITAMVDGGKVVRMESGGDVLYSALPGSGMREDLFPIRRLMIGGSKWDWYQIGGRWAGYFKLKPKASAVRGQRSIQLDDDSEAPRRELAPYAGNGGVFGNTAEPGWVDVVLKRDVDVDGMRAEAAEKAGRHWDAVHAIIDDYPPIISWEQIRMEMVDSKPEVSRGEAMEAARKAYHAQPGLVALRKANLDGGPFDTGEVYVSTREEYVTDAIDCAISSFAYIKDGVWYEKGHMGWWGMVSGEKGDGSWNHEFSRMFDSLPGDTPLAVFDCHI